MQVRLIKDCLGPDPSYDPAKSLDKDSNWPEKMVPEGTILDHPDSHYHCYGDDPNAEPFDDEAKKKLTEHLAWRESVLKQRAERDAKNSPPDESDEDESPEPVAPKLTPVAPLPFAPESVP